MLLFILARLVFGERVTCSVSQGSININSGSLTCKNPDGGYISKNLDSEEAINVVGKSKQNFITITSTEIDMFLSDVQIDPEQYSPFVVNSNSDVTLHLDGYNIFDGDDHGVACEGDSIVRIYGQDGSRFKARAYKGIALGSLTSNCRLLELDNVDGFFEQYTISDPNEPSGGAIGSGKKKSDIGSVTKIMINNSKITAVARNPNYGTIGCKVDEIIIENSQIDATNRDRGATAIGANLNNDINTISITCSNISAKVETIGRTIPNGAAIGSFKGKVHNIFIIDSAVYGLGGNNAAAIGSSIEGRYESIMIYRSEIVAEAVGDGAGIGGCAGSAEGGTIDIEKSTIKSISNSSSFAALGGKAGTMTIKCSNILAENIGADSYGVGLSSKSDRLNVYGGYFKATGTKGTTIVDGGVTQSSGGLSPDMSGKTRFNAQACQDNGIIGYKQCFPYQEPVNPEGLDDENKGGNNAVAIAVPVVVVIVIIIAAIVVFVILKKKKNDNSLDEENAAASKDTDDTPI